MISANDIAVSKVMYEEFCIGNTSKLEYGELSAKVEKLTGERIDPHFGLRPILARIMQICMDLNLPILTAKIVEKKTQFPAPGFRNEAVKIRYRPEYESMSDNEAAKSEWKLIREQRDWTPFYEFISGVSIDNIKPAKKNTEGINEDKPNNQFPVPSETKSTQITPPFSGDLQVQLYIEGELGVVSYENRSRNEKARKKCIELLGTTCVACNVSLGDVYGDQFAHKIHIHHLNPVASYEGEVAVNPMTDLVPICPNCHFVIHSKKDPYTIEEIKQFIKMT